MYDNRWHDNIVKLCYFYLNPDGERRWIHRDLYIRAGQVKVDGQVVTDADYEVYEGQTLSRDKLSVTITQAMIIEHL